MMDLEADEVEDGSRHLHYARAAKISIYAPARV